MAILRCFTRFLFLLVPYLLITLSVVDMVTVTQARTQLDDPPQPWIYLGADEEDTAWPFVVLAENTVVLRDEAEVMTGDIGANSYGEEYATVIVGKGVRAHGPSKIKGDYVRLKDECEVWDVYYNKIEKGKEAKIHGAEYTPVSLPVAHLPCLPTFTPGTEDIRVDEAEEYVLEGGDYGEITVGEQAVLVFSGGVYNLESLVVEDEAILRFNAASEVRIADRLALGSECIIISSSSSRITASEVIFYVLGTDGGSDAVAKIGRENVIHASIYAPNGTVLLGEETEAVGAFIGKKVIVDEEVELTWSTAFAHSAEADKLGLYFYNDGVYAYFNETLAAAPDPSSFTYTVYLDKPAGGAYSQDFRLVYSTGTAELQKWNGTDWNFVEDITVTAEGNSVVFKVLLESIANPSIQEDTNVWFVDYHGSNSYVCEVDRAPNTGSYFISHEVIPNLPWPTSLVFLLAVAATVYLTRKRRSKHS